MKKLKSLEKILLMVVLFALVCGVSTINKAADLNDLLQRPYINGEDVNQNNNANNQTPTTGQPATTSTNQETTLPKTGANDTVIWILAGVCALGAVYAFKKIRDYKI